MCLIIFKLLNLSGDWGLTVGVAIANIEIPDYPNVTFRNFYVF